MDLFGNGKYYNEIVRDCDIIDLIFLGLNKLSM